MLPEEYAAALSCLTAPALLPGSATAPNSYAWQLGTIDAPHYGTPFKIVVGKGTPTPTFGALAAKEAIDLFRPSYIAFVGIAGGSIAISSAREMWRSRHWSSAMSDAGVVDDELLMATEFVDGRDLRAVWNRCAKNKVAFPIEVAVHIVKELCRGLGYVHALPDLQLVHRDVSPPNVLLSYRGEIKLADSCSHRRHR